MVDEAAAALAGRCAELVRGRKVVLVGGVLAMSGRRAAQLRGFGATGVLVVAEGAGTGAGPDPEVADWVVVESAERPERVCDELAAWVRFAADPPPEAVAAVERFDPRRQAVCLLAPFATADSYLGRPVLGGRTPAAAELEDKTLADALWDVAGIARAPSVVVPVEPGSLGGAAAALDRGHGTVWSGDAAGGINGGGDAVRWVRTDADARAAVAALAEVSRTARVMPFLEGVPCSIHGFVVDDGVAAFRPVELVTLRGAGPGGVTRFVPAGISSTWEPPPADREAMRAAARRVGSLLAERVGLRGAFCVDGVLTADGWLPTELNPRFSGGLSTMAHGLPDIPFELLQGAVVRGVDVGASASVVERLVLEAADAAPFGAAHVPLPGRAVHQTETVEVTFGAGAAVVGRASAEVVGGAGDDLVSGAAGTTRGPGAALVPAGPRDPVAGTLELGPAAVGGLVRFIPAEHRRGIRFAELSLAALDLADRLWDTRFGPLTAAPDVRRPRGG